MVDQSGGGGGGKTIQVSFGDSSDVSFWQGFLGPGAGAMENRCNLGDTKELALVPGTEGPVAGASALSIVELARIRSFLPVWMSMPPANLALSQEVLHHSRKQNAPTIALPASLVRGSDSSQQVFFRIRCILWKTIANNKLFQDSWSHSFDLDLNTFCILWIQSKKEPDTSQTTELSSNHPSLVDSFFTSHFS